MIDSDGLGIIEVCKGFGASAAADVFIRMTLKKQEKHSILYYSDCSLFGDFLSIVKRNYCSGSVCFIQSTIQSVPHESTTMAKKTTTKKSAPINTMSIAELQAELQRRERGIRKLERRRERLLDELATVDAELGAVGALSSSGSIRRRPRNEMNLVDSLAAVLDNKTMSVTEVTQEVQKAGYMTTAANFRTIVNQALIREKKVFKKVARGQYTAK